MADPSLSLLDDPLLPLHDPSGNDIGSVDLPTLLARLSRAEPCAFAALRPHQAHPWHAFLVQLAAMVAHSEPGSLERSSEAWREGMLSLSDGGTTAWSLIVADLGEPAFLQPPVPEGTLDVLKHVHHCPDEVDVLITTRCHSIKPARVWRANPAHWIAALVTLQTSANYGGRGNLGVARMNGGSSNRPALMAAPSPEPWRRFRRDLELLVASRERIISTHAYPSQGGLALLWLAPWNGEDQLSPSTLDPFFIEICRRVRLVSIDGRTTLRRVATKSARVAAKELKGNLGDPWIPIRKKDGAAFTGSSNPLTYRKLHELLLSGEWVPSPALAVRNADGPAPVLMGQILSLGQSKSEGYHERVIPIPPAARPLLGKPEGLDRLGHRSQTWLNIVDAVQAKLRWATSALLADATRGGDLRQFISNHDGEVDRQYFSRLFASLDLPPEEADAAFAGFCVEAARVELERAIQALPLPHARRYRVIAEAERRFDGGIRADRLLRDLLASPQEGTNSHDRANV